MIETLVVAGDPFRREQISAWLRGSRLRATAGCAPEEAIERAGRIRPDLVLIDVAVGDGGITVCHRFSQLAYRRRVALYGRDDEQTRVAAWVVGADALIGRDASREELSAIAVAVMEGQRRLPRPSPGAVRSFGQGLNETETAVLGMSLYGVTVHEMSQALRIDPLELDCTAKELVGRLAGASGAIRKSSASTGRM